MKLTKKQYIQEVIQHLKLLGDGAIAPKYPSTGVCFELHKSHEVECLDSLWAEMPDYSGNARYPIKHPALGAAEAYFSESEVPKWDNDEYGDSRREACHWLAEWLADNTKALL